MNTVIRIARKEFAAFFSSPIAFIFLGAFLAITLFIFFWVETFFSTNIAEVRALFSWMPILLIKFPRRVGRPLSSEFHCELLAHREMLPTIRRNHSNPGRDP